MRRAAQTDSKGGRQILVRVVETYGAAKPPKYCPGWSNCALRQVPYRSRSLQEFDLDAALERKPAVLLVDDLAHRNVEDSGHPQRWQDVQELLDAVIDLWSTVNVQHLECLNGTIGAITGVRVHETVPRTPLEETDEFILVDVTPDELNTRLKAAKVCLPQQAERAAQNIFRKGNLSVLREIALRRTAEHVENDVRGYRIEKSISLVWNTEGVILVCNVSARAKGLSKLCAQPPS